MSKRIVIKYVGDLCPLNQKTSLNKRTAHMFNSGLYESCKMEIGLKVKAHVQSQFNKLGGMFTKADGPLFMDMIIFWKNRADIDAFDKLILDSLAGIAYDNDSRIKKKTTEIRENQQQSGFIMTIETMSNSLFETSKYKRILKALGLTIQ